jgi:hypothetical protein
LGRPAGERTFPDRAFPPAPGPAAAGFASTLVRDRSSPVFVVKLTLEFGVETAAEPSRITPDIFHLKQ